MSPQRAVTICDVTMEVLTIISVLALYSKLKQQPHSDQFISSRQGVRFVSHSSTDSQDEDTVVRML